MCGIVGFNWNDNEKLNELSLLLKHRGPDQEGCYCDNMISIAHRRLSIIDLSENGKQPMHNEDETMYIAYNGEIYDFQELRKELIQKGHKFISNTDTEVILHGYEEYGASILKRLNGQFAVCIYDKKKTQLFIARDRIGIKPLYYYSKDNKFIFGSELKVLLKSNIKKEINKEALNHYLLFGYTPSKQSILNDVSKLLPGHYLIYDLTKNKINQIVKYWSVSFYGKNNLTENELCNQIPIMLDKCIKKRMVADVPVGAFLSGGIDSSIIVAMMSKYTTKLKTFSIKFDYPEYNESEYANIISKQFKTDHYEIAFNAQDIRKLIPKLVFYFDEPFGDASMIPTYLVSKIAKKHVTVCLSGTGGDELFAGYDRYNQFKILKKVNHLPELARTFIIKSLNFIPLDKTNKVRTLLQNKNSDFELYIKLYSYMYRDKNEIEIDIDGLQKLNHYFRYKDDLSNLLNFDQNEYLPNDLLVKEDRATLANSLEGRVPFLDHELIEFANQISSKYKLKRNISKYILKKSFEGILTKKILYRRKKGFSVPLKYYFRSELKGFAYKTIFEFDGYDYYDKKILKNMWDKHQSDKNDYSRIFWTIIMFNLWYGEWLSGK